MKEFRIIDKTESLVRTKLLLLPIFGPVCKWPKKIGVKFPTIGRNYRKISIDRPGDTTHNFLTTYHATTHVQTRHLLNIMSLKLTFKPIVIK